MNRILLCTSPLQVVNTRSVMDYLNEGDKCDDYVIMMHPLLLDSTKYLIRNLAHELGYKGVFDLTDINQVINRKNKLFSLRNKISPMEIRKRFRNRLDNYNESIDKIGQFLKERIGDINVVFFRMSYKKIDALYVSACNPVRQKYGIEDGIGNYLPNNWKYKTLNKHEILHTLRSNFINYLSYYTSIIITGDIKVSKSVSLKHHLSFDETFTNLKKEGSVCIGDYFMNNIRKLYEEKPVHEKRKVIIFGSLIPDPRFKIDTVREVDIYNLIIEKIIKRYKVNRSTIWYKPHPRLGYDSWLYKKNYLNCSIYDFEKNTLGEIELCNPFIKAVYSVGSTAFLYAKELFNKDAYFINIRNENIHPSRNEKYRTILSSFGIEEIVP